MRSRPELGVKLRMISPFIEGGANSRKLDLHGSGSGAPGWLRSPSLKPQLRFWFRAVAGPLLDFDLGGMRDVEQAIWGSTKHTGVRLRVAGKIPRPYDQEYAAFLLPHKKEAPLVEALWPSASQRTVTFTIALERTREPAHFVSDQLAVAATVWLWANLGALGKRARRGFGSFELLARELRDGFAACDLPLFTEPAPDVEALKAHLRSGFAAAQAAIENALIARGLAIVPARAKAPPTNPFYHLADASQVWVGTQLWDAEPFDKRNQGPVFQVMSACHGARLTSPSYGQFMGNSSRYASPLWIRLARIGDDKVVPVATYGAGSPLPGPVSDVLCRLNATPV